MVILVVERATEIDVVNRLSEAGEINIDTRHEFNVNYSEDGEHCRAILKAGFSAHGQPEIMKITCTVEGDFATEKISSDEDKKKVHVECYYMLFPYVQALLMRLCTDAGLPPFYLPPLEMKEENVIVKK
ncbi:MAG: protein-export chaperone SecB [Clostridia bacterium]|nr:protein-export chaperone SecB [Clostridia bacterium]